MSQLGALIWLKWTLFRNAMRSRKAVVSSIASALTTLAALALALFVAAGLGFTTYAITSGEVVDGAAVVSSSRPLVQQQMAFLFLLTTFAVIYLLWATVPLGIGGGGQFDPGRLLLYPVSLRKLFAIDLLSELTSLASIFALPVVFAIGLGAGLASGQVALALVAVAFAVSFGVSFAKLLSISVGALLRQKRTRGETVLALLGVVAGLAGAFLGQLAPVIARHADAFLGLWWTPPGALASALTEGLRPEGSRSEYLRALATLGLYITVFVTVTYWMARRSALGAGGARRGRKPRPAAAGQSTQAVGWQLPLMTAELSAVVEKELRYAMRNAQLRMLALMPLILIGIRFMQGTNVTGRGRALPREAGRWAEAFALYGEGLLAAAGVLYVFMILSSLACNLFAYEEGGMRAFILSPLDRRTILVGKNIAVTTLALLFAALLVVVNQLVFRDLTARALGFALLAFVFFAPVFALVGNWLSIHYPKRMQFGKRMNATGIAGLLLIPIVLGLGVPPLVAAAAGYAAQSLVVKYATLALFAVAAVAAYALLITAQGRSLSRREFDILEAVSGRTEA